MVNIEVAPPLRKFKGANALAAALADHCRLVDTTATPFARCSLGSNTCKGGFVPTQLLEAVRGARGADGKLNKTIKEIIRDVGEVANLYQQCGAGGCKVAQRKAAKRKSTNGHEVQHRHREKY